MRGVPPLARAAQCFRSAPALAIDRPPHALPSLPSNGAATPGRRALLQTVCAAAMAFEAPALAHASQPWIPLSQVAGLPATSYPEPFVMYLARFLIRYDERSRSWYRGIVMPSDWRETARGEARLHDQLSSFGASLSVRLAPFSTAGKAGTAELWSRLEHAYAGDASVQWQLGLLFSLLPPTEQPVGLIRAAIGASDTSISSTSVGVDAPADTEADPAALLPPDQLLPASVSPTWDPVSGGFRLPRSYGDALATSIFGSVAASPITREKRLGPLEYSRFAASGGLGCAMTHLSVVPLDVVKTRIQTRPGQYTSIPDAARSIAKEEGLPMLFQGAGATGFGYFLYGVSVYPGYEFFRRFFFELAGPQLELVARVPLVLLAGATATVFTCFLITPFETVRIRMVEDPEFAPDLRAALQRYVDEAGFESLYDGLIPLMIRQVLFGMVKFLVFDSASDAILAALPPNAGDDLGVSLGVSLLSGAIAGALAAIVSQPADVVLTRVAQGAKEGGQLPGSVNQIALIIAEFRSVTYKLGLPGLFTGLGSRCLWSCAIIAGQFLLYDVFKSALHVTAADLSLYYDAFGATAAFSPS